MLVEDGTFEDEGRECSLKARFIVDAIVLAQLPERRGEGMGIREGKKSS